MSDVEIVVLYPPLNEKKKNRDPKKQQQPSISLYLTIILHI